MAIRMLLALVLVVGACKRAQVEQREVAARPGPPRVTVSVTATVTGLSSEDIERMVVAPMEVAIGAVEGVRAMRSVARRGRAVVVAEIEGGDPAPKVRRAVAGMVHTVPSTMMPAVVERGDVEAPPGLWLALQGNATRAEMSELISGMIAPRLVEAPGVLNVDLRNTVARAVIVRLDPARLDAFGVTIEDLERAVASGAHGIDVLAGVEVKRVEGASVRLRDFARVEQGIAPPASSAPPTGSVQPTDSALPAGSTAPTALPAPMIGVRLRPEEDAAGVRAAIAEITSSMPASMTLAEVPAPPAERSHSITISVRGFDWNTVARVADQLERLARQHPELVREVASTHVPETVTQGHEFDADAAARLAISPAQLARAAEGVLGELGRLGDEPVLLRIADHEGVEPDDLEHLRLEAAPPVALARFARLTATRDATLTRRDGEYAIDVLAEPAPGTLAAPAAAALIALAGKPPAGTRITPASR